MTERRRTRRIHAPGVRARVRHGHHLRVIDVSPEGALVEAGGPLRPGAYVELQMEHNDRSGLFAATVVRCDVSAISAHRGTTYRAGLAFRERCDWVCEASTQRESQLPATDRVMSAGDENMVHEAGVDMFGRVKKE